MTRLGEIADIQTGPFGSQLHSKDYVQNEGVPIVTVEHLGARSFSNQNLPLVAYPDQLRLKKYTMRSGDTIFSRVGSVDRCSYAMPENDGWLFSGRCLRVRPQAEVDPMFLYSYLSSEKARSFIRKIAVGATMPSINTTIMGEMPVDLPPLSTQKRIGCFIDKLDSKIELNNRINDYLEELITIQFRELRNSQKWPCSRADGVFEIGIGKTPPRKESKWFSDENKGNIVWLSIKDMGATGAYAFDSSEYLTPDAVKAKNVRLVQKGSVLLSFKLTVGRVKIAAVDMTTNEAIACFASKDPKRLAYIYPYLLSFDYNKLGSTSSIATAVNSKTIKSMPIVMPDEGSLDSFYAATEPLYEAMFNNTAETRALEQLRDDLLPKLMSGEIDVSQIDLTQLNNRLSDC